MMRASSFLFVLALMCSCSEERTDRFDEQVVAVPGNAIALQDTMPSPDPIGISFGSSFGMCAGYCQYEFALHQWGIAGIRKAGPLENSEIPPQRIWARLPVERLKSVIALIDTMDLGEPSEVMGCPDCADGGSCWLEVDYDDRLKSLSYDCVHGAGRFQTLMDRLKALDPSPIENADGLVMPGLPHWE